MKMNNAPLLYFFLFSIYIASNTQEAIGQTQHTVNFNQDLLTVSAIVMDDGNQYSKVEYEGLSNSDVVGEPSLPVRYVNLLVPSNDASFDIVISDLTTHNVNLPNKIQPTQSPIPSKLLSASAEFTPPNSTIYSSTNPFPSNLVSIVKDGYFDGCNHIVTIAVYPLQYLPSTNKAVFHTNITIKLVAKTLKSATTDISPITRNIQRTTDGLELIVANQNDIEKYQTTYSTKSATLSEWNVPFYEYVIVTTKQLIPAFQDLLSWKRRKGLNAGIVSIEDILQDVSATGDAVSNINDDAGKLRQYLTEGYKNGTKYALLGGDYATIPVRYGSGSNNTSKYQVEGDANIPSDLYYSDLNGNWNVDGADADGIIRYGEPNNDAVDYFPEIYVGRILCSTTEHVQNWVDKVLIYEQNPGKGDYSYLTKSLMTQADHLQQYGDAKKPASTISSHFTNLIWSEIPSYYASNPQFPKGAELVSELNNHYGLYSSFNHGSPNGIATASNGNLSYGPNYTYALCAVDAFDLSTSAWIDESGNGLDNLTNNNFPFVFYSASCETMPYDLWLRTAGTRTMGEVFTTHHSAGGLAYLGNTRYGWVSHSSILFNNFLTKMLSEQVYQIGKTEAFSKTIRNFGMYHWICLAHNLLGDPETEMWTAIPSLFSGVQVTEINSNISVSTNGVDDCNISLMSALDNGASMHETIRGASATFANVIKPYHLVVTKHNYIPFVMNPDIFIQNETLSSDSYITGKTISAGTNVTTSKPEGPAKINNGANVVLNAEGDILLDKGFEIEQGSTLETK
jgi:hypothetical protein